MGLVRSIVNSNECNIYGKPAQGTTFHYEFCCCFPQPAHTLHALESSIFNGIFCRLLHLSDLDLSTTMSYNFGPDGVPKSQNNLLLLAIFQAEKKLLF